ncbi:MAG: glycosyltransferase family 87 protein [Janthinobacterium lividum]
MIPAWPGVAGEADLTPFPSSRGAALPPAISRMTKTVVAVLVLVTIAMAAVQAASAVGSDPARPEIVDFHPFYLAGTTVWDGHFARSYDGSAMRALQRAFGGGKDVFMPFVYPPLFGLVMAPLALLPVGLAFLLFTGGTLAFYIAVMRRLAGPWFWPAVLAVGPVLLIDIRLGQNGFLTAGLAGLAADLALKRRSAWAGVAAGALAFKPQVATMLPVLFAFRRDWRALVAAAAAAVLLTGSAVLILGLDTVPAFLSSTSVVAEFMGAGTFPLHRMTSVYASALSLGLPARLSLAIHGIVALAAVTAAAVTAHRLSRSSTARDAADPRTAAGVMLMATAFVSPYFFDYDLTVFGAGLALALPGLALRIPPRGLVALLIVVGGIGALGLVWEVAITLGATATLSLGGPALLACFGVMLRALGRQGTVRPAARAR